MSRSKRSQPITGITTAESEKEWKRDANRKLRRAVSQTTAASGRICPAEPSKCKQRAFCTH